MKTAQPPLTDAPLADVLLRAAAEVIIENGLAAFSIREVARRAGVSHAAPGYHFGGTEGLLTALAVEGLKALHAEMTDAAATTTNPIARLSAVGRAYVRVASTHPAHCEVIYREDLINSAGQECETAGLVAIEVLEETIAAVAAAHNHELDVRNAVTLYWSAMQGLIQTQTRRTRMDQLRGLPDTSLEDAVDQITKLIVTGIMSD